MSGSPTLLPESRLGSTLRRDPWWMEILPVAVVLGGFGVYATLRAFENAYYFWGPYLSPFYSPLIDPQHRWWPFSPALLILAGPLGFRATCYYYRKAYYRAFFLDPPACAVGESPRRKYRGETAFPFILQNVHRYFFYLAVLFIAFLWYDAFRSFFFDGRFGVGVGKLDCFSCANFGRSRFAAWRFSTFLNERHMLFAWCSLFSVGFADFYVRMLASGAIRDLRLL